MAACCGQQQGAGTGPASPKQLPAASLTRRPVDLFASTAVRKLARTQLPPWFVPTVQTTLLRCPLKREMGFKSVGVTGCWGESWQRKSQQGQCLGQSHISTAPHRRHQLPEMQCALRKAHRTGTGRENQAGQQAAGTGPCPACYLLGLGCCLAVAGAESVPPSPSHQHPGRTSPVPQEPMREIGQMNHFLQVPILGLHFKRQRVTLCTPVPKTTRSTPPGKGGHSSQGQTHRRGRNPTPGSQLCPPVPLASSGGAQARRAIWSKALGSRGIRAGGGKMGTRFSSFPPLQLIRNTLQEPGAGSHAHPERGWEGKAVPDCVGQGLGHGRRGEKAGTGKRRAANKYTGKGRRQRTKLTPKTSLMRTLAALPRKQAGSSGQGARGTGAFPCWGPSIAVPKTRGPAGRAKPSVLQTLSPCSQQGS